MKGKSIRNESVYIPTNFTLCRKYQDSSHSLVHNKSVMTIYEQIQKSVEFIEENLCTALYQEDACAAAGMSARSFQDYFWSVTGFQYKDYLVKRRLAKAADLLRSTEKTILEVALEIGYQSHEGFSRAFKFEFNLSPQEFRKGRNSLNTIEKLVIIKEMYMGVIIKDLPDLLVVTFSGFAPEPESKAKEKMEQWMSRGAPSNRPQRVFGHNVDRAGNIDNNPQNVGYKLLITVADEADAKGEKTEILPGGKFVVTGIEGNFNDDPQGNWIREGWQRMAGMVEKKGYKVKTPGRWYEEELEPQVPGNLRLDLYLEIEV